MQKHVFIFFMDTILRDLDIYLAISIATPFLPSKHQKMSSTYVSNPVYGQRSRDAKHWTCCPNQSTGLSRPADWHCKVLGCDGVRDWRMVGYRARRAGQIFTQKNTGVLIPLCVEAYWGYLGIHFQASTKPSHEHMPNKRSVLV